MNNLPQSNQKTSAIDKLSKLMLIGIVLSPILLFFGFITYGILSFSPGGNINQKELLAIQNKQLIALFIKQQKSFVIQNNKLADNDSQLSSLKEQRISLEKQGYQIELQSGNNSSIITSRDNLSKNENFFGVIKISKIDNIKISESQSIEGLSFICISKQNVPLPSKIELANIASVATSSAKNNCPVGYIQKYQDTLQHGLAKKQNYG